MKANDETPQAKKAHKPRAKWPHRLAIALAIALVAACLAAGAFLVYASSYYHDADAHHENLASTAQLPVEQGDGYLAFGDPNASVGLVFYPGAKVEYSAYAPLMHDLAERGVFSVVVQMPFNFAFFDINAADRVRAAYPAITSWWVGGHSLGGSMAAQYAADHADDPSMKGVVLAASYSASDLSHANLGAVSVYGSNDQVLNRSKLEENAGLLPSESSTVEIAGGNHAGFGDYGPQDGDGSASISPEQQRGQAADIIAAYLLDREQAATPPSASLPQAA